MDTDTQTHQISDQHDPTIGMRTIGGFFPFQDQPEYQGGKQGRISIYLALHGAKPECIAKRISQRTYQTATHDRNHLSQRHRFIVFHDNLTSQMSNTPEKE